jgi:hypothetical protein
VNIMQPPDPDQVARDGDDGVRWLVVDEVLLPFTARSVVSLVAAAADSPFYRTSEYHLTLLWARMLRHPSAGTEAAGPEHLPLLLDAAERATSTPLNDPDRIPNDPRLNVRFLLRGYRWRLHPGDLDHPLLVLRRLEQTALALDDAVRQEMGFSLSDVLEVCLAHGHRMLEVLAPAWPDIPDIGRNPRQLDLAEVVAADRVLVVEPGSESARTDPVGAGLALAWMTTDAGDLTTRHRPNDPVLGRTLLVRSGGLYFGVPACEALRAAAAAAEELTKLVGDAGDPAVRLHAQTWNHATDLFERRLVNRRQDNPEPPPPQPMVEGPRFVAAIVSGVATDGLNGALAWGTRLLSSADALGPGPRERTASRLSPSGLPPVKLVVYGGPSCVVAQTVDGVVLVHVEELAEMVDEAGGDLGTVICFLEDLVHHDGYTSVAFVDLLDVWWAWREYGQLGDPAGTTPRQGLAIRPSASDLTWERAATWESVDGVLTEAGFAAEHFDWPYPRLDGDDGADLFWKASLPAMLVNIDPPIVLDTDLADAEAVGTTSDAVFAFADAMRLHLRLPRLAAHIRSADGRPLRLNLRWAPRGAFDAADALALGQIDHARRQILLVMAAELFDLFAVDSATAHQTVGEALSQALAQLRDAGPDEATSEEGAFRAGWEAAGVFTTATRQVESVPTAFRVDALPRSMTVRARAARRAFAAVRDSGAPDGVFTGETASQLCQRQLLPALQDALRTLVDRFDHTLVRMVAARVNDGHATEHRRNQQVAVALAGPWADNWAEFAADDEQRVQTHAMETLFEALLAEPPAGDITADELAIAEITALAHLLTVAAATHRGFTDGVHGLRLSVPQGVFSIGSMPSAIDEPDRVEIDVAAYQRAQRAARHFAQRHQPERDTDGDPAESQTVGLPGTRVEGNFRSVRGSLPDLLAGVDEGLRERWGTGFDGFNAVLGVAVDWPTGPTGICEIHRGELVEAVVDWAGHAVDRPEAEAAIERLSLVGDQLQEAGPLRFLDIEKREHRMALRPLVRVNGMLLLMPWRLFQTRQLLVAYLNQARLPYHRSHLPAESIDDLMNNYRKALNDELEEMAHRAVEATGLPCRANVNLKELKDAGIKDPRGEIDLIVADASTGRLWVCEVKNLTASFSSRTVRHQIRQFHRGRKGFVSTLLAKVDQVAENAMAIAALCGVDEQRDWRVVPLFVTRQVEPAAFAALPQVPFALVHQVADILTSPADPSPGAVSLHAKAADH